MDGAAPKLFLKAVMNSPVKGPVLANQSSADDDGLFEVVATPDDLSSLQRRSAQSSNDITQRLQDPFLGLKYTDDDIRQYLSDAHHRFQNCEGHEGFHAVGEIRKLMKTADAVVSSELEKVVCELQTRAASTIIDFRCRVFSMAMTVLESIKYLNSNDPDLVAECNDSLDGALKDIDNMAGRTKADLIKVFESQTQLATVHCESRKHQQKRVDLVTAASSSSWAVLVLLVAVACIGLRDPMSLCRFGLTLLWYVPHYQQDGKLYYRQMAEDNQMFAAWHPGWFFGLVFLGIVLCGYNGYAFTWIRSLSGLRDQETIRSKASVVVAKDAKQNELMWTGMTMSIESFKDSLHKFRNVNPLRQERKLHEMHEAAFKLFAMSMSVDEYIMSLSEGGLFPTNFSVRMALSPQRYDVIKDVFEKRREPSASLPAASKGE